MFTSPSVFPPRTKQLKRNRKKNIHFDERMTTLNEQPETEKSALNIIKHWFFNSPSHGIRRINRATSLPGRVFWSMIFLIFTSLMCTFIHSAITKYITHPTKINLSVRQYQDSMHYPAITFCKSSSLTRRLERRIGSSR